MATSRAKLFFLSNGLIVIFLATSACQHRSSDFTHAYNGATSPDRVIKPDWVNNTPARLSNGMIAVMGFAPKQKNGDFSVQMRVAQIDAERSWHEQKNLRTQVSSKRQEICSISSFGHSGCDHESQVEIKTQGIVAPQSGQTIKHWVDPESGTLYVLRYFFETNILEK